MNKSIISLIIAAAAISSLAGCGYRTGSLTPTAIRTIHVQMFDNETFRRGLEFQLTEAVQNEIRKRTDIRLVDKNQADSILAGSIIEFRGRTEIRDVEDEVFLQDVRIYVNYTWTERRTGRVLAERTRISRSVRIYSTRGETVGFAATESFRLLAEAIVDSMIEGW